MSTWEEELRVSFPGYLLPSANIEAISREAASRFLDRITGRNDSLRILLATSALAPVASEISRFAQELQFVAQVLPSRTEVEQVESESQVRGRPDVAATLRRRASSGAGRVVSQVRKRHFDLPENILLVSVARRLTELLAKLEERGAIAKGAKQGWAVGFSASSEKLTHVLNSTVLREVPHVRIEAFHEQAARAASHSAYRLALRLHMAMKLIDTTEPRTIAQVLADGALFPLEVETRFELAVLIRLGRSIESALVGRNYSVERALFEKDRSFVFVFSSGRDLIRIHYNQVIFAEHGPRDRGIHHYFGEKGRIRPDITVEILRDGRRISAMIVEVKLSEKKEYLKSGYEQALLYRAEYAQSLQGWPKVVLVVSSDIAIQGELRREDEVVAVDWKRWVPQILLEALLADFGLPAQ